MNGFWASSHASDSCAVVASFLLASSVTIDKRLIRGYAFRPETIKSSTQIRLRIKLSLCIKILRQIAHANGAPGHKADSQFFAGIEQSILFRVTVHERILCLELASSSSEKSFIGFCRDPKEIVCAG
jgi:hypothetical protein